MDKEIAVQDLELQSLIGFDGNPMNGLIVHPDGEHLIYPLGTNITAYNWSTRTQRFFEGHTNVISTVAVSRTGRYVGAGQVNHMGFRSPIIVWEFGTGRAIAKYETHMVRVQSAAFSCCERFLMSLGGLDDGTVVVYDIEKKEVLCGSSTVKCTAGLSTVLKPMHARGECFVVAGDNTLRLWTVNEERRSLRGLDATFAKIKRAILCVAVDCLDEYAYCGTSTGDVLKIKLNVSPDATVATPPALVGCFAKHPTAGTRRGTAAAVTVEMYRKGVTALHLVADDGTTMIVGSGDGVVELVRQKPPPPPRPRDDWWSAAVENKLTAPTRPLLVAVRTVDVGSSVTSIQLMNATILVGTAACELFTVGLDDFNVVRLFTCHTSAVYDLAFPHDYGEVFATASADDVRVWSMRTLRELLRITVKNCTCSGVLFAHDGSQIVTSWNDGRVRAFSPESGSPMYTVENCHKNGVTAIAMSRDGNTLVSGGGDGQVRVWRLQHQVGGTLLVAFKEHKGPVSSVHMHPTDHEAITSSSDGTCVVWDVVRFTRVAILFSSTVFTSAKFHPNGTQLITCGTNRYIGFWEATDGSLIREIEGSPSSALNSLDVTPAGDYIVTGSSDQMVKLWLYNEGVPTHVGIGHAGVVTNVKISPDGRCLVSTSADGGIFLWRFPHNEAEDAPDRPSTTATAASAGGSPREQQTERSRRLSAMKTMPARRENINTISLTQNVISKSSSSSSSSSAVARKGAKAGGSVKCLCRRGTTCVCGNGDAAETARLKPSGK